MEERQELQDAAERLKLRRKNIRKHSAGQQFAKEERLSEASADVTAISQLLSCKAVVNDLQQTIQVVKDGRKVDTGAIDMLSAYLLAVSVYTNAVRPAAALSLNLSDFVAARWEDNYMIMRCVHHKTSSTHGPAKILLKEPQSGLLQGYVQVVRPTLPCISQQPLLLVNNRGEAIKNYQHYLHKLTEAYNLPQLPTPTAARRAISATVASHGTSADLHLVSKQLGHLTSTSEKYYQAARSTRDSITANQIIGSVLGK